MDPSIKKEDWVLETLKFGGEEEIDDFEINNPWFIRFRLGDDESIFYGLHHMIGKIIQYFKYDNIGVRTVRDIQYINEWYADNNFSFNDKENDDLNYNLNDDLDYNHDDVVTFPGGAGEKRTCTFIDYICRLIRVPRVCLGIVAMPNGSFDGKSDVITITGNEVYKDENGYKINDYFLECACQENDDREIKIEIKKENSKGVLLIERYGIYNALRKWAVEEGYILVCYSGFPTLATKGLVFMLHNEWDLPIYALPDCDPCGFERMLSFFCSRNGYEDKFKVNLKWIGPFPRDMIEKRDLKHFDSRRVLKPLTEYDKKKLKSIIELYDNNHPFFGVNGGEKKQQLELMLDENIKVGTHDVIYNYMTSIELRGKLQQEEQKDLLFYMKQIIKEGTGTENSKAL